MANKVTEFFFVLADAVAEVGHGAVADVRNTWEEAWFGQALTPEGNAAPLRPLLEVKEELVEAVQDLRGVASMAEFYGQRVEAAFDKLLDEFAKERASRGPCGHEFDREHEIDR
jgi:hypothetical protein